MNWKHPDYIAIFDERLKRLATLRRSPGGIERLKPFYKNNPAQFINDWGTTFDPRNVERGLPALIPFILFPKQIEWINWIVENWKNRQPGLTEKSRDIGVSWLAMALACTLCLHYDGMVIGFGSRKEEYVDKLGDLKALLPKARIFMQNLPTDFRGGWEMNQHAPHKRIMFPNTGSTITGEAGDNIGRGDRTSIYFVDEAAHLERPELIEASLSQTTNCRQDVSSANGMANSFAQKRFSGNLPVFTIHWRDDPRKDDEWYAKQVKDLSNPVVVAQEIDIDYSASVEGLLIPSAWIQSAIDAHKKFGIVPTGSIVAALDVADEGKDKNAWCCKHGILVQHIEEWSGKGSDIYQTVERSFALCDKYNVTELRYDADGLGTNVRGDGRKINENREVTKSPIIITTAFRGSAKVYRPLAQDVKGRKNEDFFANSKSQAWWHLRKLFENTHRAVTQELGREVDLDNIISLDGNMAYLSKLQTELIQPTYAINNAGKIVIDKVPDGMASPNLADSLMILFSDLRSPIKISSEAIGRMAQPLLPPDPIAVIRAAQNMKARGMTVSEDAIKQFIR